MDIRQEIAAHVQTLARRGRGKAGAMKQAADALTLLSQASDDNKPLIVAAGAVTGLVALLGGNSADGRASAAGALRPLALNDAAKEAMVAEGVISRLIALARDGGDYAKASAAGALANISWNNSENKVKIAEAGGIEVFISVAGEGGRGAVTAACALFDLSFNDENKVKIVEAGGIDVLVDILRERVCGRRGGAIQAAGALCNLSSNDEAKIALVVADAIPLLLDRARGLYMGALKNHTRQALRRLDMDDKSELSNAEICGIPLLVKLSRDGSPSVKKRAVDALQTLTANGSSKAEAELKVADAAVDEARSRRDDRVRESAKAASLRDDAETALKRAEAAASEARSRRDDWLRFQNAALQAKVDELERRPAKKQRTDLETCVICLDAPRAMVLFPCAHACLCAACGGALASCPICRADVASRAAIILS